MKFFGFIFNSFMSPYLGFWVIRTGYWPVPSSLDDKPYKSVIMIIIPNARKLGKNLFKPFSRKNMFVMKNLTNFHKTVKTSVDLHLKFFVIFLVLKFKVIQVWKGGSLKLFSGWNKASWACESWFLVKRCGGLLVMLTSAVSFFMCQRKSKKTGKRCGLHPLKVT